jgi:hypothetical protein
MIYFRNLGNLAPYAAQLAQMAESLASLLENRKITILSKYNDIENSVFVVEADNRIYAAWATVHTVFSGSCFHGANNCWNCVKLPFYLPLESEKFTDDHRAFSIVKYLEAVAAKCKQDQKVEQVLPTKDATTTAMSVSSLPFFAQAA